MIYNTLELSTANISPQTAAYLDIAVNNPDDPDDPDDPDYPAASSKSGYDYYLPISEGMADAYPDLPDDLANVIGYALKKGCTCQIFDSDAVTDENLPDFTEYWDAHRKYAFVFDDERVTRLKTFIENNYFPQPWPLISNILEYAAAQGLGFEETIDLLANLLDGTGITVREIECCLIR